MKASEAPLSLLAVEVRGCATGLEGGRAGPLGRQPLQPLALLLGERCSHSPGCLLTVGSLLNDPGYC